MTPKYMRTVINGKKLFDNPQVVQAHFDRLEGKDFEMTQKERRDPRAAIQFAYYWSVVVATIAKDTGNDPEEVHEALKEMFAPQKIIIRQARESHLRVYA